MNLRKILISVSGGRTSAILAYLLWNKYKNDPTVQLVFVFANTSREDEKTLIFVKNLEAYFGFPIVWVEAVVHHGTRKGSTHKVVTFETAKRNGEVFEDIISKYGIPNKAFLHCTRELKTNAIRSYMKSIGWGGYKKYTTVIGMRADEIKRIDKDYKPGMPFSDYEFNDIKCQWYPLIAWGITKADVAVFWKKQLFDLGLADYEGNCKKCYKKTDTKIITQVVLDPTDDWIERMEKKYGFFSGNRNIDKCPPPYTFFRHNRTLAEVMEGYVPGFRLAIDKSMITDGAEYQFIDDQDQCAEGECSPFQ